MSSAPVPNGINLSVTVQEIGTGPILEQDGSCPYFRPYLLIAHCKEVFTA